MEAIHGVGGTSLHRLSGREGNERLRHLDPDVVGGVVERAVARSGRDLAGAEVEVVVAAGTLGELPLDDRLDEHRLAFGERARERDEQVAAKEAVRGGLGIDQDPVDANGVNAVVLVVDVVVDAERQQAERGTRRDDLAARGDDDVRAGVVDDLRAHLRHREGGLDRIPPVSAGGRLGDQPPLSQAAGEIAVRRRQGFELGQALDPGVLARIHVERENTLVAAQQSVDVALAAIRAGEREIARRVAGEELLEHRGRPGGERNRELLTLRRRARREEIPAPDDRLVEGHLDLQDSTRARRDETGGGLQVAGRDRFGKAVRDAIGECRRSLDPEAARHAFGGEQVDLGPGLDPELAVAQRERGAERDLADHGRMFDRRAQRGRIERRRRRLGGECGCGQSQSEQTGENSTVHRRSLLPTLRPDSSGSPGGCPARGLAGRARTSPD